MTRKELRPCDACRGPLFGKRAMDVAYKVRSSIVILDHNAVRQHDAMERMFGGANALSMNFAPDKIATVAGEEEPKLWTDMFLCMTCHMEALGQTLESRNDARQEAERATEVQP